jgi:opacity protein-like surface antigen
MKLSLLAGVTISALILVASQASAADYAPPSGPSYRPYVSVFGGASFLTKNPHTVDTKGTDSYDFLMNNPGYIIGGAVGVDWGNQLRTEIELSHARWSSDKYQSHSDGALNTIDSPSVQSATYLLGNAWYDFGHGSVLTPYVGGGLGIGFARFDEDNGSYVYDATGFAFQLGAGVRFNVSDNISIDAGYRFKDIIGLNYNTSGGYLLTDTSLASHNFQVGLTLQF